MVAKPIGSLLSHESHVFVLCRIEDFVQETFDMGLQIGETLPNQWPFPLRNSIAILVPAHTDLAPIKLQYTFIWYQKSPPLGEP